VAAVALRPGAESSPPPHDEIFTASDNPHVPIAIYSYKRAVVAAASEHLDALPVSETPHDGVDVPVVSHSEADTAPAASGSAASGTPMVRPAASSQAEQQVRAAGQRLIDLIPTLQKEALNKIVADGVFTRQAATFAQLRAGLAGGAAQAPALANAALADAGLTGQVRGLLGRLDDAVATHGAEPVAVQRDLSQLGEAVTHWARETGITPSPGRVAGGWPALSADQRQRVADTALQIASAHRPGDTPELTALKTAAANARIAALKIQAGTAGEGGLAAHLSAGQARAALAQARAQQAARPHSDGNASALSVTVDGRSFTAGPVQANGNEVADDNQATFRFGSPSNVLVRAGPGVGGGFFTALLESARLQGHDEKLTEMGITTAQELREATLDAYARQAVAHGDPLDGDLHGFDPESLGYWMEDGARYAIELAGIVREEGFAEAIAAVIHEARFDGTRLGALLPVITAQLLNLPITMVVSSATGTEATALGQPDVPQIAVAYDSARRSWRTLAPQETEPLSDPGPVVVADSDRAGATYPARVRWQAGLDGHAVRNKTGLSGGWRSWEAEYVYPMRINGKTELTEQEAERYRRRELARGPLFNVTIEVTRYGVGSDGKLYYSSEAARAAGVTVARTALTPIPEFGPGLLAALPGEATGGDARRERAYVAFEEKIRGLRGNHADRPPFVPLRSALPSDQHWALTDLGRNTEISPEPLRGAWHGDRTGTHHSVGVPLPVIRRLLEYVQGRTSIPAASEHLGDALRFGDALAAQYPQTSGEEAETLAGIMALGYVGAASLALHLTNSHSIGLKGHAAVLARHDMNDLLAGAPEGVQLFVEENPEMIQGYFASFFRGRVPDYDAQFERGQGRSSPVNVLAPVSGTRKNPGNYLLGRLRQAGVFNMTVLPVLDRTPDGEPQAVLEVRALAGPDGAGAVIKGNRRLGEVVRSLQRDRVERRLGEAEDLRPVSIGLPPLPGVLNVEAQETRRLLEPLIRSIEQGIVIRREWDMPVPRLEITELTDGPGPLGGSGHRNADAVREYLKQRLGASLGRAPRDRTLLTSATAVSDLVEDILPASWVRGELQEPGAGRHLVPGRRVTVRPRLDRDDRDEHLVGLVRSQLSRYRYHGERRITGEQIWGTFLRYKYTAEIGRGTAAQADYVAQVIINGGVPLGLDGGAPDRAGATGRRSVSDPAGARPRVARRAEIPASPSEALEREVQRALARRGAFGKISESSAPEHEVDAVVPETAGETVPGATAEIDSPVGAPSGLTLDSNFVSEVNVRLGWGEPARASEEQIREAWGIVQEQLSYAPKTTVEQVARIVEVLQAGEVGKLVAGAPSWGNSVRRLIGRRAGGQQSAVVDVAGALGSPGPLTAEQSAAVEALVNGVLARGTGSAWASILQDRLRLGEWEPGSRGAILEALLRALDPMIEGADNDRRERLLDLVGLVERMRDQRFEFQAQEEPPAVAARGLGERVRGGVARLTGGPDVIAALRRRPREWTPEEREAIGQEAVRRMNAAAQGVSRAASRAEPHEAARLKALQDLLTQSGLRAEDWGPVLRELGNIVDAMYHSGLDSKTQDDLIASATAIGRLLNFPDVREKETEERVRELMGGGPGGFPLPSDKDLPADANPELIDRLVSGVLKHMEGNGSPGRGSVTRSAVWWEYARLEGEFPGAGEDELVRMLASSFMPGGTPVRRTWAHDEKAVPSVEGASALSASDPNVVARQMPGTPGPSLARNPFLLSAVSDLLRGEGFREVEVSQAEVERAWAEVLQGQVAGVLNAGFEDQARMIAEVLKDWATDSRLAGALASPPAYAPYGTGDGQAPVEQHDGLYARGTGAGEFQQGSSRQRGSSRDGGEPGPSRAAPQLPLHEDEPSPTAASAVTPEFASEVNRLLRLRGLPQVTEDGILAAVTAGHVTDARGIADFIAEQMPGAGGVVPVNPAFTAHHMVTGISRNLSANAPPLSGPATTRLRRIMAEHLSSSWPGAVHAADLIETSGQADDALHEPGLSLMTGRPAVPVRELAVLRELSDPAGHVPAGQVLDQLNEKLASGREEDQAEAHDLIAKLAALVKDHFSEAGMNGDGQLRLVIAQGDFAAASYIAKTVRGLLGHSVVLVVEGLGEVNICG